MVGVWRETKHHGWWRSEDSWSAPSPADPKVFQESGVGWGICHSGRFHQVKVWQTQRAGPCPWDPSCGMFTPGPIQ